MIEQSTNIENQTSLEAATELNIFYDNSIVDLYFQNAIKESYVEKTRTFRLDNNPDTQICFIFASAVINYLDSLKLSTALTDERYDQNGHANVTLCYSNELQKEILVDFIAEMLFKFTLSHQDQDFDKIPTVCDVEADTNYIVHKCLTMWLEVNQRKVNRSDKERSLFLSIGVKHYLQHTLQTNICMKKSEKIIYQPRATAAMINQLKDYRMLCQINKITEAVYNEIAPLDHNQAVEFIAEAIYSIAFKQSDASQHVRSYPIHMRDIDSSQNAIIRSIRMMASLSQNDSSLYYNSQYGDDTNSDPNKLN